MLQFSDLTIEKTVANQSGAMESETIQKNGRNPKSLMSRRNFKLFAVFLLVAAGIITIKSCKKDENDKVPQNVIDLVKAPEEFPEEKEWLRKEVTVPGSETSRTEESNTPGPDYTPKSGKSLTERSNDPSEGIRRLSVDECFAYNVKWNCETVKVSASENPDDFVMFNPLASVLWPGNLIQGESLKSGVPTTIPVTKRQSGNVSLAIVSSDAGGAANKMYRTVEKMQMSYVNQAMNEILSGFGGNGYAQYFFESEFISSFEELSFKLNASYAADR